MALTTLQETILAKKIELDKLNKEKDDLIASRASKIAAAQSTYDSTVASIHATDDVAITNKEADIATKLTEIDTELGK